jgi:hypothetical protein
MLSHMTLVDTMISIRLPSRGLRLIVRWRFVSNVRRADADSILSCGVAFVAED